jgi:hypothetical protein
MTMFLKLMLLLGLSFETAHGFAIPEILSSLAQHHSIVENLQPLFHNMGTSVVDRYRDSLIAHPLYTQMATGGVLAVAGDALAQKKAGEKTYDERRAVSFMAFDMAYRALQHVAFPLIVANCHGQYGGAVLKTVGLSCDTSILAAVEGTMVNQLAIVPFLYYPVFFTFTALIQGLDMEEGYQRARSKFLPLMQRNLMFWVPIQFIQFRFVEENLQIPFVCVAGLIWTIILSTVAGNTQQTSLEPEQSTAQ